FQAEDGIRDRNVTGVQTCALPIYFYSKQGNVIQPIEPGTYSLSNASLNTPWPKVVKARTRLENYLFKNDTVDPQILFKQLSDDTLAEDNELPDTGVGQTIE